MTGLLKGVALLRGHYFVEVNCLGWWENQHCPRDPISVSLFQLGITHSFLNKWIKHRNREMKQIRTQANNTSLKDLPTSYPPTDLPSSGSEKSPWGICSCCFLRHKCSSAHWYTNTTTVYACAIFLTRLQELLETCGKEWKGPPVLQTFVRG